MGLAFDLFEWISLTYVMLRQARRPTERLDFFKMVYQYPILMLAMHGSAWQMMFLGYSATWNPYEANMVRFHLADALRRVMGWDTYQPWAFMSLNFDRELSTRATNWLPYETSVQFDPNLLFQRQSQVCGGGEGSHATYEPYVHEA